ncbi:hypothetical protein CEXT_132131 [Caerostris extrusa]|uniref:Uncharacterized protein n=1 Tax=Caerostris extrusa TaxID=172846 RepID=A0AAV4WGK3_CAEEX|nr:hypothetical protein CEXT_132131 [Caerostris extrusa]
MVQRDEYFFSTLVFHPVLPSNSGDFYYVFGQEGGYFFFLDSIRHLPRRRWEVNRRPPAALPIRCRLLAFLVKSQMTESSIWTVIVLIQFLEWTLCLR